MEAVEEGAEAEGATIPSRSAYNPALYFLHPIILV